MVKPLIVKDHKGGKILIESEPISIAKARSGRKPFEEIWAHKRYLKEAKEERVEGLRRGRAIYLPLEEEIEFEGSTYSIKNIKGSGANYLEEELLIDPKYGPANANGRMKRYRGSIMTRIWGAVTQTDAQEEVQTYQYLKKYLTFSPIVGLNIIPKEAMENIDLEGEDSLAQLVRLSKTNIRISDIWKPQMSELEIDPEIIAKALVEFIELERLSLENNHYLEYCGKTIDNMYVDGTYTDAENFEFRKVENRAQTEGTIKQLRKIHEEFSGIFADEEEFDKFYQILDKKYNTKIGQRFREWESEEKFGAQVDNEFEEILRN